MSVRTTIVLLLALSTLAFLVGCGSSSPKAVPPPSGGFNNSNFSGTYVFSSTGSDGSGAFLTVVGDLVANGTGGITGGTFDLADGITGVSTNNAITSGSYRVTADGRGLATLKTAGGPITFDFVLTSNSHGLVTEFDGNGTGSGTLDLQPAAVAQTALAGSYSFSISGVGSSNVSYATVGSITLDASGTATAGVEDINNGGSATTNQAISTSSSILVGSGTAPGTAHIAAGAGTSYAFDVYAIDSTHFKLIETDGQLFLSGDAFTQGTSIPSGQFVYTMAGSNNSNVAIGAVPLFSGGYFTNTSGTITAGLQDFNDGGTVSASGITGITGSITAPAGGRSQLSFTGFVNGAANDVPGNYTFAAYPFSANGIAGLQLLEIDGLGVTSGAAFVQTNTTLASGQGYGMNLSGINSGNGFGSFEEDDIAEFVTTSSGFTGIVDLNDQGNITPGKSLSGTYTAPSSGRGTATSNFFNGNFYVINGSTLLFLETDSNQVGLGVIEQQGSSASPGAAQSAVSMLHAAVPHAALRRKQ
jgi:hypothetical protein